MSGSSASESTTAASCAGCRVWTDVQHIGSTAIPSLRAKDVADILVGVLAGKVHAGAARLSELGDVLEGEQVGHAWLCWPAGEGHEAVIHVMEKGSDPWHKRLRYCYYLRQHSAEAQAYEALKLVLAAQTDDWGESTWRKAAFVERLLCSAHSERPLTASSTEVRGH